MSLAVMLEGRERVLQNVEPLLRQVGLVAVLLQPFDEFLLTGNVVLGLGDVPIPGRGVPSRSRSAMVAEPSTDQRSIMAIPRTALPRRSIFP
jgi:hypothetical protein